MSCFFGKFKKSWTACEGTVIVHFESFSRDGEQTGDALTTHIAFMIFLN
jgi:hypothetical protein